MSDETRAWFYHHVVAAYDAYVQERDSNVTGRYQHRRAAIEAATALFHFLEHLPPSVALDRRAVEAACPAFALVANVANAAKHHTRSDPKALVKLAADVSERVIATRYSDAEGDYIDATSVVTVACSDGSKRHLDPALTEVLNFWSDQLRHAGITDYQPRPLPVAPGSAWVARDDARMPALEALRSLDFSQTWQLQWWNPDTGRAEAENLEGANLQFRIFQPAYALDIRMTDAEGNSPIVATVNLSPGDAMRYQAARSEAEKDALMEEIANAHRGEIERQIRESIAAGQAGPQEK